MSSGWPIGAGKCGSLIASKCGQWGRVSAAPTMASTLYGAFLFKGSLGSKVLSGSYGNCIDRVDNPFGTVSSGPTIVSSFTHHGIIYATTWARFRAFFGFAIPNPQPLIAATLKFTYQLHAGNAFNIDVYAGLSCSNPPVAGDWSNANTGTLIGQYAAASATIYVPVPISLLTPGSTIYFSVSDDNDLTNTSPGASSDYGSIGAGTSLILSW